MPSQPAAQDKIGEAAADGTVDTDGTAPATGGSGGSGGILSAVSMLPQTVKQAGLQVRWFDTA